MLCIQKTEESDMPFKKSPNLIDRKKMFKWRKLPAPEGNSGEKSSYRINAHKNTKNVILWYLNFSVNSNMF